MVIRIKGVNDIKTVVTTLMVYKKVRRKKGRETWHPKQNRRVPKRGKVNISSLKAICISQRG